MTDETIHAQPLPKRPETGLQAWLATVGYISQEYSPDATLTMRASTDASGDVVWAAQATWGQNEEAVAAQAALFMALRELWRVIDRAHTIFKSVEAATRRPANYPNERWIDEETQITLDQMIGVTMAAFAPDWRLIIVYQPLEDAQTRVQARLLARLLANPDEEVHIGGRGPSIRAACQALYRNAAPDYFASIGRPLDYLA
ncbi:MAG: hypothetical protein GYB67_12165 [Chloroflexi bacterium]|nr:hypothetical protein [Chloroflexota bacterium]